MKRQEMRDCEMMIKIILAWAILFLTLNIKKLDYRAKLASYRIILNKIVSAVPRSFERQAILHNSFSLFIDNIS